MSTFLKKILLFWALFWAICRFWALFLGLFWVLFTLSTFLSVFLSTFLSTLIFEHFFEYFFEYFFGYFWASKPFLTETGNSWEKNWHEMSCFEKFSHKMPITHHSLSSPIEPIPVQFSCRPILSANSPESGKKDQKEYLNQNNWIEMSLSLIFSFQ